MRCDGSEVSSQRQAETEISALASMQRGDLFRLAQEQHGSAQLCDLETKQRWFQGDGERPWLGYKSFGSRIKKFGTELNTLGKLPL